jgi:hypothetical protein
MKKITFTLLTALGLSTGVFGQAVVSTQAPQYDGSSTGLSFPNGVTGFEYHRSSYLILASELSGLALTNSVVTAIGVDLTQGCDIPLTGQFTVSLENTSDVTYSKGQTWSTILTGMSTNYTGNLTFPVNTGFASVPLTLTAPFTYTGGGIYIACEWTTSAAPSATLPARTQANSSGLTIGGCYGSGSLTAPATLTNNTAFRPAITFSAANTATNEVGVVTMYALGKVSKLFTAGHVVTAEIRNNSGVTMSNIPVTLNVTGANTFNDVQTVTSLAAGATTMVSFLPFNPTVNGLNTLSVTVPADEVLGNNSTAWSQTVTCNDFAFIPPLPAASFTDTQWGLNPSGVYAYEFTPPSNCNLTGVNMVVSSNTAAAGVQMVGVVVDLSTGNVLASTNTITLNSSMLQTTQTMLFDVPYAMTGGTNYYIGVAQVPGGGTAYPYSSIDPGYQINNFYRGNPLGAALVQADRGYVAIGALVNTIGLTSSASKTVVCKKDGPNTVTLTATGTADTYSWTSSGNTSVGSGSQIAVTPTVTSTQGVIIYNVVGTETSSGCQTNKATITVSVSACTALSSLSANGYDVKLFPNPALNGKSKITGLVGTNNVTVYNTLGQVVSTQTVSEDTMTLDLSSQPSGNYMVKISDSNNESRMIKIVNQN